MKREKYDPELIIEKQMKGVKFKKTRISIKIRSYQPGQEYEWGSDPGFSLADWGYHKCVTVEGRSDFHYKITHIPSGQFAFKVDSAKEARELTYRLFLMPITWDGTGEAPADFKNMGGDIIQEFLDRTPIKVRKSDGTIIDAWA